MTFTGEALAISKERPTTATESFCAVPVEAIASESSELLEISDSLELEISELLEDVSLELEIAELLDSSVKFKTLILRTWH